jgi:hypothetical protein
MEWPPVILIDAKGILHGKRLRKLTARAHLYYPFLLGMSNFYARLELDEELLYLPFVPFNDVDLTAAAIGSFIREYTGVGLAMLYTAPDGATWVQFDTPVAMRRSHPTTDDNLSPAPPGDEYVAWLQTIHGDLWQEFDLSAYQRKLEGDREQWRQELSEKRRAAGIASGEARRNKREQAGTDANNGNYGVVPVVGAGVDEGDVEGGVVVPTAITTGNTVSTHLHSSINNSNNKATIAADPDAFQLAKDFRAVLECNPGFDAAKLPGTWERLWTDDMREALTHCDDNDGVVRMLMAVSQTPEQARYNVTARGFVKNLDRLSTLYTKLYGAKQLDAALDSFTKKLKSSTPVPADHDELDDDDFC